MPFDPQCPLVRRDNWRWATWSRVVLCVNYAAELAFCRMRNISLQMVQRPVAWPPENTVQHTKNRLHGVLQLLWGVRPICSRQHGVANEADGQAFDLKWVVWCDLYCFEIRILGM